MRKFGEDFAKSLKGGEVIELVGDVGAGKTTFAKGLARGLKIEEEVQSPTFTLSRVYEVPENSRNLETLTHYDFYRLNDAGIMKMELAESLENPRNITLVEWAESVGETFAELPDFAKKITVKIDYLAEDGREVLVS